MRNARSELADGFQLLRLRQLALKQLALGDIAEDANQAHDYSI